MAANVIQILIEAKDNATAKIAQVEGAISRSGVGAVALAAGIGAAGLAITAMAGAAVAGAARLKELGKEAEQLQNLSAKTGTSASQIQSMTKQLEDMGIGAESLSVGLRFLQKNIVDNADKLADYGITAKDTMGALMQLSDLFAKMPDGPNKTRIAMELLGNRGGTALIPFLNQGSAAIQRTTADLREMGSVLDDKTIKSLAAFDDQNDRLHRSLEGLKNQIAISMLPLMKRFAESAQDMADAMRHAREEAGKPWPTTGEILAGMGAALKTQFMVGVGATGALPSAARSERLRGRIVHTPFGSMTVDEMGGAFKVPGAEPGATPTPGVTGGAAYNAVDAMRRIQESANATMAWRNNPGPSATAGVADMYFANLGKSLEKVTVPALKLTDAGKLLADRFDTLAAAGERMRSGVAMNVDQMISTVVYGSQNIRSVFSDLMTGILQTFEEAALKAGIGFGLDVLGTAIGGPIGGFIGKVGGKIATNAAGGGGNTFVVQSIDSKSALDALVNPTGSFRGANDRLREVAMAS